MERTHLSFDGKGINGPDEYRTRIATFNKDLEPKEVEKYGHLLESAPELLEALKDVLDFLKRSGYDTTENYDELESRVKAGYAEFYVPTYTRCTRIDARTFQRFGKIGQTPLKKSKDGKGFLLSSGRKFVYVMEHGLDVY